MGTTRTLEERLKFDSGLSVGTHLVLFTHEGKERKALVEITVRGKVRVLTEPGRGDMYSSWCTVKGDKTVSDGGTIVWAARNPEMMEPFKGEVVATVAVEASERAKAAA